MQLELPEIAQSIEFQFRMAFGADLFNSEQLKTLVCKFVGKFQIYKFT